jgi:uridylate kinase
MADAKRVMLKLSGETLLGELDYGIDFTILEHVSGQIVAVARAGYEVAVVVGAGNIWRHRDTTDSGIERVASDNMGMLATVMNSVALMSSIEKQGVAARVCSAVDVPQVAEPYITRRAIRHLEKERVVICSGGTGNPYFTTDSAAALRALELKCEVLLKATNVDGVYSADPKKDKSAIRYDAISYDEVLEKDLKVMDGAAISLCRDSAMPLRVFKFGEEGAIERAIKGEIGTKVG